MPNLFDRLGKPRPAETNTVNELTQKPLPAQELLDWLLGYWPKPTIRKRDIYRFGPNALRDRQKVTDLTETLVKEGWLVPNKTRRRDMYQWGIIRKPIIHPVITAK